MTTTPEPTAERIVGELLDIRAIWDQRKYNGSRTPTQAGELMSKELGRIIESLRDAGRPATTPTVEQIIAQAALDADTVLPDAPYPKEQAADIAKLAAERLRAAGLLVGAPTKEQIERGAWALIGSDTDTEDRGVNAEQTALVAMSKWIDEGNAHRDPEAATWGRLAKITEEAGEVVEAFIGATGQNPRKGVFKTFDDVRAELLDVAVTALAAYEHIDEHRGRALEALAAKIRSVAARAGVAPQKPSKEIHEPDASRIYCVRCGYDWPCQPAPSPDRENLIAEAWYRYAAENGISPEFAKVPEGSSRRAFFAGADALAAPPVLDPEKVAKVVHDALPDDNSAGEYTDFGRCKHGPDTACVTIARALCEAAERGELS